MPPPGSTLTTRTSNRGRRRRASPPSGPPRGSAPTGAGDFSLFDLVVGLFDEPRYWLYVYGLGGPRRTNRPGSVPIYQAQPVPTPAPAPTPTPAPRPGTQPFPREPAANEPWPNRRAFPKLPDWITRAPITPQRILLETGKQILRRIRELDRQREQREQENARQIGRRRLGRREELPEIVFPAPAPETAPAPVPVVVPRPAPVEFPDFPVQIPKVEPIPRLPSPVPLPGTAPQFPRIPRPSLPRVAPAARPAKTPLIQPGWLPSAFPEIPTRAIPRRQSFPTGDQFPGTASLTSFQPQGVGSTSFQPTPQAAQQAEAQCQVVKRRRRRKGKCREGFFVERAGETEYTTWRERECATGLVVKDSKDNVIELPEL